MKLKLVHWWKIFDFPIKKMDVTRVITHVRGFNLEFTQINPKIIT